MTVKPANGATGGVFDTPVFVVQLVHKDAGHRWPFIRAFRWEASVTSIQPPESKDPPTPIMPLADCGNQPGQPTLIENPVPREYIAQFRNEPGVHIHAHALRCVHTNFQHLKARHT